MLNYYITLKDCFYDFAWMTRYIDTKRKVLGK